MKKINEETKTQIKELFATEKFSKVELGKMFGLDRHTIDRIISGKPNPKVNNKKYYKREKTKEYVRNFRKKHEGAISKAKKKRRKEAAKRAKRKR